MTARVVQYFTQLGQDFGATPEGVGWSAASQRVRFEMIVRTLDLEGKSLLDVGCGYGGLLDFLRERHISCRYRGLDIAPIQIINARARHPADADAFAVGILDDLPSEERFDVVVANGLVNLESPTAADDMRSLLGSAFGRCTRAALVTAISSKAPRVIAGVQQHDPGGVLRLALELTPLVVLDHAYLAHDFAVVCYRDASTVRREPAEWS